MILIILEIIIDIIIMMITCGRVFSRTRVPG